MLKGLVVELCESQEKAWACNATHIHCQDSIELNLSLLDSRSSSLCLNAGWSYCVCLSGAGTSDQYKFLPNTQITFDIP